MAEERDDKKRGRAWEKEENNSFGEVGGREYSATSERMHPKKANLARNKHLSKRFWVQRQGLRLVQNPNPHINLGLQRLRRCAVEVQQRNS